MRNVIGVAAEYNPFHLGHALQLEKSKALLPGAAVVCVMSGDFVQRGEAAIFPKHLRAESAVKCGADLVLELPLPWSLASAEGFARGMAALLRDTGVVTHMSFGSECGDAETLKAVSAAMGTESYRAALQEQMKTGVSYAAARQQALGTVGADTTILDGPNDLLGIEYLNAMAALGANLSPIAIRREGAGHDEVGTGALRSASQLRQLLRAGEAIDGFLPREAGKVFFDAAMPDSARLETAILARLQMLPQAAFADTPGAGEGLENLLYKAVHTESTLEAVCMAAKSKRYALSRIRRMAISAALGVTKADAVGLPPYLRVLAANETGRGLLREMKDRAALPILTKPAAAKELPEEARRIFERTAAGHDLYALCSSDPMQRTPGGDWRASPIML